VLADYTDTTVILYDPTYGIVEYDRELFLRRWNEIGPFRDKTRQAVIIR
jgi:predicted double-glycine peptidase